MTAAAAPRAHASEETLLRAVNDVLVIGRQVLVMLQIAVAILSCIAAMWVVHIVKK